MEENNIIAFSKKELKEIENVSDLVNETIRKFEEEKFPKYIYNYKQYLWYVLDRLTELQDWQTNISYPLASSIIDTEFANLFDFDFVFGIQEPKFKELCNATFDYNSQWRIALKDALKECLICGEWFTRTWLYKNTEKYSILGWSKKIEVKTKKPTIEYTSIFNVFYDMSYWIKASPYQITRVFNTWDYIHKKYCGLFRWSKLTDAKIKAHINKILKSTNRKWNRFSNYDYNPVKTINNFSTMITKSHKNATPINTSVRMINDEISKIDQNNFYLVNSSKSYEIVEVDYNDKLYVYIDGKLLYVGSPILPWELGIIRWISFNDIPWSWTSNWQIDNLAHLQSILNWVWNAFLDNIKMQMSGMFAVYGNVPWLSRDGKIKFEKFKWIKMTPDAEIKRLDFWLNDFSPLNVNQYVEWAVEKRAWVNGYLLWGQSKVERVSDSINLIHDQYKSKLTPIIDSVQMMMGKVSKAWVLIYLKYFTEEELNKLWLEFGQDEEWKITVNDYLIEDIINDENISFKFNSLRNIEKEKKRWIIKEIFQSLIQMKQMNPEQIDELFNILLDDEFDLKKFKWIAQAAEWVPPEWELAEAWWEAPMPEAVPEQQGQGDLMAQLKWLWI